MSNTTTIKRAHQPVMEIEHWVTAVRATPYEVHASGIKGEYESSTCLVKFFTHDGYSERCVEFTSLEVNLFAKTFTCRLPKSYRYQWIPRLCEHFAWECLKICEEEGRV